MREDREKKMGEKKYLAGAEKLHWLGRAVPTLLVALGVFALDAATPVGLAVWLFQVILVCIAMFRADRRQILTISSACFALIVLAFVLSPKARPVIWIDWANVLLCLIAIGGMTWACLRMRATEESLRVLKGMLPICAWCKKIRNERGGWENLEVYIREHSQAEFTHSICRDCAAGAMTEPERGKAAAE